MSAHRGSYGGRGAPSRPGPRRLLLAAGYVLALVIPGIGVLISFWVARDQSRGGQKHAVRIFVLALASFAIYWLIR